MLFIEGNKKKFLESTHEDIGDNAGLVKRLKGVEEEEIAGHGHRHLENQMRNGMKQRGFIVPEVGNTDYLIIALWVGAIIAHLSLLPRG
ncbi:hypothetical protein Ancab_018293 [Ancistrocladus abbreviatus]